MRVSRTFIAAAAAASLLLAGTGAAVAAPADGTASATPLLSRFDDGSFEYPVVTPGRFVELPAGQTIGPWQITSGSVDLIGAGFWQAAEGDQSVDLSGGTAGTIAQTFTTVPGTTYTVTYALAGNFGGAPTVKTGKVLIDGQNLQDFSFDITGKSATDMGYVYRQFTFVATATATTLSFVSTTASAHGPVIDDVTVTTCPPCNSCG
ncbi:choice-of-anchor C family protein [Streptomyces harbinensis]|uniref:choice-of-anchor C family protein n=1 Tax=Streptomyces harbinensis TaxID=1176198 RepID=UPI0036C02A00